MGDQRTHGGTETAIDLEDRELVEVGRILGLREIGIGHDLVFSRRLDAVPVTVKMIDGVRSAHSVKKSLSLRHLQIDRFCTLSEITCKKVEECLHLGIERLDGAR